ncbi:UAA transporter [Quaeritorhiza haematococci]|nr:UAA transporter [Quaeritorhiza haematococci]
MNADNKIILKLFNFNFPWLLTAIHSLVSAIGATLAVHYIDAHTLRRTSALGLYTPISTTPSSKFSASTPTTALNPSPLSLNTPTPTLLSPTTGLLRRTLNFKEQVIMFAFSILYTANIATSNLSLSMVSLPFHQIVRSTNPAVTVTFERLLFGRRRTYETYASLAMVIMGVSLACVGELEFSLLGFLLTLLGVLLSSIKGIATNFILVGNLKMHPLELLRRMAGLSFFQCLFMAWLSGEVGAYLEFARALGGAGVVAMAAVGGGGLGGGWEDDSISGGSVEGVPVGVVSGAGATANSRLRGRYYEDAHLNERPETGGSPGVASSPSSAWSFMSGGSESGLNSLHLLYWALAANGILAFLLNFVSFTANKRTSALSMTVAGNVKQVLSITLSVWLFNYVITGLNGLGECK